jgi:hypothetical protein
VSARGFPLDLLAPYDSHFEYAAEATKLTSARDRRGLSLAHNLATEAFDASIDSRLACRSIFGGG